MNEEQIVNNFSKKMLEKIAVRHNRYAPLGWQTMDVKRLVTLLKGELAEFEEALADEKYMDARDEAIDIANYALFLHEVVND